MVARIQINYILSRCAAAENTVLMTLGFALRPSATQTPSWYGHMAKVSRPLSMGSWQYAVGRKKAEKRVADQERNARDKTGNKKGIAGSDRRCSGRHARLPCTSPGSILVGDAFFLPSAYCHVPILSSLPTSAMCQYRLGVWVVAHTLGQHTHSWLAHNLGQHTHTLLVSIQS